MSSPNDSFVPLADEDIPYIDGQGEPAKNGVELKDATDASADAPTEGAGLLQVCGRFSFPCLLLLSVIQLSIYLNKLYQDSAAVGQYFLEDQYAFCIASCACLFVPALIYMIYILALYVKDKEEPEPKEMGTKMVNGMLLVPWQIKSRVEVLQFSAQRVCQIRPLTKSELYDKSVLERQALVLEFFENFYAGLMQLLLQLYIIIRQLDRQQEYKALTGQIIASALTLISMMAAVRRRDDYILTGFLSVVGWTSIMISRAVAIALATTIIQGWIILACLAHALAISAWITHVAIATYQESSFNQRRKIAMYFLVLSVFGLPSLAYWPIMFDLRKKRRPFIFLMVLLLENVLLLLLWGYMREDRGWYRHDYTLLSVTIACQAVGTLFLMFYLCCKPKYTDYVVYHDMKAENAESFGMYYEFCDAAFKLTKKEIVEEKLKEIRTQARATEG